MGQNLPKKLLLLIYIHFLRGEPVHAEMVHISMIYLYHRVKIFRIIEFYIFGEISKQHYATSYPFYPVFAKVILYNSKWRQLHFGNLWILGIC